MVKYLFVTGGVVSSLGKGITISSIAALLKASGYNKIKMKKLDPYLNVDPGTMNPFEHGEVFVTKDGKETDLDLGNYERFTEIETDYLSNITIGRLLLTLLTKEREGKYLGKTVQIVPHLTNDIKKFITESDTDNKYDFILVEVGGTVGDVEAPAIFEAIRQLKYELGSKNALNIHVTLVPYIQAAKELKTKPTQHSVKDLMSVGITPDILICRSQRKLKSEQINKIASFCNVDLPSVIEAVDVKSIYEVPIRYSKQNLTENILAKLDLHSTTPDLTQWITLNSRISSVKDVKTITIIGKYVPYDDAYISLVESIKHACWFNNVKPNIEWINSRDETDMSISTLLKDTDCVIIPGGFGKDGLKLKLDALEYCRNNNIPLLGICLGMQLMILEYTRNVLKILSTTEELGGEGRSVVGFLDSWESEVTNTPTNIPIKVKREKSGNLGGTMRLGNYTTCLKPDTFVYQLYDRSNEIVERHRHRYEVKITQKELDKLIVCGVSKDNIPEIVELSDHPFYIGCQFHPEYKSTPFSPRPLFLGLIRSTFSTKM